MTSKKINRIIENHQHWLNMDCEGWEDMRADFTGVALLGVELRGENLRGVSFEGADLRDADLSKANLEEAGFKGANLKGAVLREAYLLNINLSEANLMKADLRNAYLRGANLRDADLSKAYLLGADLKGADLKGACVINAYLGGAYLLETTNLPFYSYSMSRKGSFIGFKKARKDLKTLVVVELLIKEDARRSSATGRKCRCDKAKVLSITNLDGSEQYEEAFSCYDYNFIYKVGNEVSASNFCEDRFKECAAGIHFFLNSEEAVRY